MKRILLFFIAMALLWAASITSYGQMSSADYAITTSVFYGGRVPITSGTYKTNGTVGQPTPLEPNSPAQSDTSYDLHPGFWYWIPV